MSRILFKRVYLNLRQFALLAACRELHTSKQLQTQLPQLSPQDINIILRENEFTYTLPATDSVVQAYETNQLGSNSPCEDSRTEASLVHKNAFISGVFDGHGGAACGQVISKRLLRYIAAAAIDRDVLKTELKKGCSSQSFLKCYNDTVDFVKEIKDLYEESFKTYVQKVAEQKKKDNVEEIEYAFMQLDDDLSKEALQNTNLRTLAVAISGAVTCVAYIENCDLYVGSTGDCAAVLGSFCPETGKWQVKKLNNEHNTDNLQEVERILAQHPRVEHDTAIKNNRLLGQLAPLRAFGDFRYKWSNEILEKVVVPVFGPNAIAPNYHTPPYLTAQPEIQHHVLGPNDKFLVIATDGLWDFMSPTEVVRLVSEHMMSKKITLKLPEGDVTLQQVSDILKERKAGSRVSPLDQNAATHLIRHALGATEYGIEHSKISYYLTLPKDVVRYYRDDITITVIYFNSDQIKKLNKTAETSKAK